MNYNILHLLTKPSTIDELVVKVRKSSSRKSVYNAIYRTLREARGMGLVECQKTSYRHIWSRTNIPLPLPLTQLGFSYSTPSEKRKYHIKQELLIARQAIDNILEILK